MTSDGRPAIFLSYAHDNEQHRSAVLEFAELLVRSGIVRVELDEWRTGRRQDWYAWMVDRIRNADYVIVVASPKYRAVGDGVAPGDLHRGVQAEASLIRELLYEDRVKWLPRIIPVVLPGGSLSDLPSFVQPHTASHYRVDELTGDGIEMVLKVVGSSHPEPVRVPPELVWEPLAEAVPVRWRSELLDGSGTTPPRATLELHLVPTRVTNRIPVSRLAELGGELAVLGRDFFPAGEEVATGASKEIAGAFVTGPDAWAGLAVHRDGQRSVWGPLLRAPIGSVFDRGDVEKRLATQLELLLAIGLDPPHAVVPVAGLDPVGILRKGPVDPAGPMTFPVGLPTRVRLDADESVRVEALRELTAQTAAELTARLAMAIPFE